MTKEDQMQRLAGARVIASALRNRAPMFASIYDREMMEAAARHIERLTGDVEALTASNARYAATVRESLEQLSPEEAQRIIYDDVETARRGGS